MAGLADVYKPQYEAAAKSAAASFGIPTEIFLSLVQQESGWNPNAMGTSGEWGFTQLKQGAADDVGANRYDPVSNLRGGAAYLARQFKATGNWFDALRSYNQGASGAAKDPNAGKQYAEEVLTRAQSMGWDGKNANTATGSTQSTAEDFLQFRLNAGSAVVGMLNNAASALGMGNEVFGKSMRMEDFKAIQKTMQDGATATAQEWLTQGAVYILAIGVILAFMWYSVNSLFNAGVAK